MKSSYFLSVLACVLINEITLLFQEKTNTGNEIAQEMKQIENCVEQNAVNKYPENCIELNTYTQYDHELISTTRETDFAECN